MISLEMTAIDRFNSGKAAAHAFVATTTRSAVSVPLGVRSTHGRDLEKCVTGECS
jgi:hypothetical protein